MWSLNESYEINQNWYCNNCEINHNCTNCDVMNNMVLAKFWVETILSKVEDVKKEVYRPVVCGCWKVMKLSKKNKWALY